MIFFAVYREQFLIHIAS